MGCSRSNAELIKPVFLMAGIPLAFSLAAFILTKISARKSTSSCSLEPSSPAFQFDFPETDSHVDESDDDQGSDDATTLLSLAKLSQEEIFSLTTSIKELEAKVFEIESRFLRYHDLKEREFELMEFQNSLLLELARVEAMDMEVSSMEAEHQRFEGLAIDYLKALEVVESSRLENGMLQKKVKKLLKRLKGRSSLISEQNLQIEAKEAVISRNDKELESRKDSIKGLEDEIEELQTAIKQLLEEKIELLNKIELAENSATVKSEAERESFEDHNQLEPLQQDRTAEVKEQTYQRRCNACLREELLRKNQDYEEKFEGKKSKPELDFGTSVEMGKFGSSQNESERSIVLDGDSSISLNSGREDRSKRQSKLYAKLKKLMQGSEKVTKPKYEKKNKPELKWFGSHSVANAGGSFV